MKNAYYRDYMLKRYHQRMNRARDSLGGKCIKCGSSEELEIDHIDRDKKSFPIAKFWSYSIARFKEELNKCQLLCESCHKEKTLIDLGKKSAKNSHGTLSTVRYCKCEECRKVKNAYMREWKKRKALKQNTI